MFPPESHGELLDRLAALEARCRSTRRPSCKGEPLDADPIVVVRVRLVPATRRSSSSCSCGPAPGAPLFAPGAGPRDVLLAAPTARARLRAARPRRRAGARRAALLARLPLGDAEEGPPRLLPVATATPRSRSSHALADAAARARGRVDRRRARRSSSARAAERAARADRQASATGSASPASSKIEPGRLELAVLLDAARRQQRFVRVDDDRWVELSRRRCASGCSAIADRTFARQHGSSSCRRRGRRDPRARDAGVEVDAAPRVAGAHRAARARRSGCGPRPPAALRRDAARLPGRGPRVARRGSRRGARAACLADDMGLGKTVQAIALLLDRAKLGPALVLAPTSVALNWVDELRGSRRRCAPIALRRGSDRARVPRTLGKRRRADRELRPARARRRRSSPAATFATLVLDEAQALKNPTTQRAKAARALDAEFRVALSGTPLENHLGELWSLFAIVFPGLLGSWEQFRDRFAIADRARPGPRRRAPALSRVIRPFLLRRTKAEVARELPPRTEIEVPVALSDEERAALRGRAARRGRASSRREAKGMRDEQRRFQVLAALTRLRLLASHPRLYDPASPVASSKLQRARRAARGAARRGPPRARVQPVHVAPRAGPRGARRAPGIRYALPRRRDARARSARELDRARSRPARATCS